MADDIDDGLFDDLPPDEGDDDLPPEDLGMDDLEDEAPAGEASQQKMLELADLLGEMNVVIDVDEGMTMDEMMDHLCTGLRTHLKTSGEDLPPDEEEELADDNPEEQPVEEPQMITMSRLKSLEEDNARLRQHYTDQMVRSVSVEIDEHLASGRCTPKQAEEWRKALKQPEVRMSLGGDKKDALLAATIGAIRFAREVPEGTFLPKTNKNAPANLPKKSPLTPTRMSQANDAQPSIEADPPDLGSTEERKKFATNELIRAAGLNPKS